ncbi:hypothetical protein F5884DRAFT_905518 [Xylogone sp. PMI_703]|nr:hypothetical protein F5884DRAFT_905518 [Xylogone sp. PMI_703]
MQNGLLVKGWPIVLDYEGFGVVVEVGESVNKFKVRDEMTGVVRVRFPGYMIFQEYLLRDKSITMKKPSNLLHEEVVMISVIIITVSMGLVVGAGLQVPEALLAPKDE